MKTIVGGREEVDQNQLKLNTKIITWPSYKNNRKKPSVIGILYMVIFQYFSNLANFHFFKTFFQLILFVLLTSTNFFLYPLALRPF